MAKEKGFFQEEGLDVTLKEYENGIYVVKEVEEERAHFAIGRSSLVRDILDQNKELLLLFALAQADPVILQTTKRDDIKSLQDLKGKKAIVSGGTNGAGFDEFSVSIASMLISQGFKASDFTFIPARSYDPIDITNGYGDFITAYSTITPYHLKKLGFESQTFHPKDYGYDFYGDILFTHQGFYRSNPQIVDAFYKAALKGWHYAYEHIDESIELIKTKYNTQNLDRDILEFEANEFKKLSFFQNIPLGDINPIKIEKIVNSHRLLNLVKSPNMEYENFIYTPPSGDKVYFSSLEKIYLKKYKTLKVGIVKDLFPLDFQDQLSNHAGISHDILKIIAQKTGLNFQKVYDSLDNLIVALEDNKIDFIISIPSIEHPSFYFTDAFIDFEESLFVRENTKKLDKIGIFTLTKEQFKTKQKLILERFKDKEVVNFTNIDEAITKLRKKNIDALFAPKQSVYDTLNKNNIQDIELSFPDQILENNSLHVAVKKEADTLYSILEKSIKSIPLETSQELKNRWKPFVVQESFDWRKVYLSFGILIFVVLILTYKHNHIKKLNKKLQDLSSKDALTNLYNRRYFGEIAQSISQIASRKHLPLSFVMLDVDDFKKINDTYGHSFGDKVLQEIATILLETTRKSDIVARYGGEEFVILLPDTTKEGAKSIANKIQTHLRKKTFHLANTPLKVSMSIGISCINPDDKTTIEMLYKEADLAMYKAKSQGKNCIVA
jgi:polar amino acid transport system substrate-binding protein